MDFTIVAAQIRRRAALLWDALASRLLNREKRPGRKDPKQAKKQVEREGARAHKADPVLLGTKKTVNFRIAEEYLGVTARQRQRLISMGRLEVIGGGSGKQITTESLRRYLPPAEKPN
jgi:hypothetical protein